jgi:hypothetical protein
MSPQHPMRLRRRRCTVMTTFTTAKSAIAMMILLVLIIVIMTTTTTITTVNNKTHHQVSAVNGGDQYLPSWTFSNLAVMAQSHEEGEVEEEYVEDETSTTTELGEHDEGEYEEVADEEEDGQAEGEIDEEEHDEAEEYEEAFEEEEEGEEDEVEDEENEESAYESHGESSTNAEADGNANHHDTSRIAGNEEGKVHTPANAPLDKYTVPKDMDALLLYAKTFPDVAAGAVIASFVVLSAVLGAFTRKSNKKKGE